ncbi:hypothetical protein Godav_021912 [Gossypium davidsonii]|uniref:ADF-H domain-containing protein n=1 Tax=Gossypium davidsonii TaxID=34287 RepID=A0A7J8T808_GOSDV|nr:hypothetical protein [Gossypium davidsonii]
MCAAGHAKDTFLELKRKKIYRYLVFRIDEKKRKVVVEKTGDPAETYDDFTASLPENDCRYAVYDFDFVTSDNCQKSKIFFIAWLVFFPFDCLYIVVNTFGSSHKGRDINEGMQLKETSIWPMFCLISVGNKNRLLVLRAFGSPSSSRIRSKVLYATSKHGLREELDGIHYEIQATDPTEMDLEVLKDRAN